MRLHVTVKSHERKKTSTSPGFEQPWSVCGIWGNRLWGSLAQSSQVGTHSNHKQPNLRTLVLLNMFYDLKHFQVWRWALKRHAMTAKQCIANHWWRVTLNNASFYCLLCCIVTLCLVNAMWHDINQIKTGHCSHQTFILIPFWSYFFDFKLTLLVMENIESQKLSLRCSLYLRIMSLLVFVFHKIELFLVILLFAVDLWIMLV